MASFKLVFLFVLVSFLNYATTKAQDFRPIGYACSDNKTTPNGPFQLDLRTLLSYLTSNATGNKQFYNTTVAGRNHSETVYGLFMCRSDVPPHLCQRCVVNVTEAIYYVCYLSKEVTAWYDDCMVRYSNRSFFSTVDTSTSIWLPNYANISKSNQASFLSLVLLTLNRTADEAANNPKKYATKEANISRCQTLYCLVQCTPDLSPQDCSKCLSAIIREVPPNCVGKQGCGALSPNCNLMYQLYPFYLRSHDSAPTSPAASVPSANSSNTVPKFSEDPVYYNHSCSSNRTFTANGYKELILDILFPSLIFKATQNTEYYDDAVNDRNSSDSAYWLFMCRGDIPPLPCRRCVQKATERISSECRLSKEAIIWYEQCLLRYSDRDFSETVDTYPRIALFNTTNTSSISNLNQQRFFTWLLGNTLITLIRVLHRATNSECDGDRCYATKSVKINEFQTLYTLAQCTPDLSRQACLGCLYDVIGSAIPWRCLGSAGGRVLYPSCTLRFELFPFYRDGDEAQAPRPASASRGGPTEKRKSWSGTVILIVVPTVVSAILFSFGFYLLRRKARKSYKAILRENFGLESATLEPLQFELAIIEAATNHFSHENMIGKGGFGEVYKGILYDGRHVAVKKLSRSSKQGAVEFKNEILLIAKLQHRNLVAFMGFCLEEQEKILVYEYVPNGSLDYFLFDTQQQKLLNWSQRYNIIGGIARGILYLHEYSRLKIIHRDLKPSNILLDENMNPKIADFGLARIVEISQDQGSTNRIVGTYGYMSPEYAMLGQFSEKSDVFSFGVIVLETITGKKNISSCNSHHVADGLLSYVWRQWRDETPLSILHPNMIENCSQIEVIKCIQIGLLCVQNNPDARPTMAAIVSYLTNHSIRLPSPQEPAFFLPKKKEPNIAAQESSSSHSVNSSAPFSINEMSISEFLPRC